MKHGIIVLQQLRTIIYFTFSNFLADCEYQMAKPSEGPPPPRLFVSSGKLQLEREALKIAIGVLNPPNYIDLPLTQKVAFKECLTGLMAFDHCTIRFKL